ncbi:lipopolysaccharide transport periplasmic protein LptA [Allofranklinella schreckenbergeri]|uniref:Lipopolysaccharide export system protein LptA n=1 Tax=Allofranklinella schreckenbergeri TaxID=1076744 RepID=A0A3M6R5J6_9BURK|nr:lipopolysaccharide transport periplasmic protein LptA [Allofranklinella schreckenbergeri]RMX10557.1 lipopolysaccharide transport periplasmic protein LptA [Allofranklinella schreckenbergeri]
MKKLWISLAVLAAACSMASNALALASDRNQPMNVEADGLRHDDAAQVTVFSGNVVVTKGTIVLKGDKLTVQQRADGSQFGTVEASGGRRAFFRQQRDTPKGAPVEVVEAQAGRIEYDSKADQVKLIGKAELRRLQAGRLNDEIDGAVIVYNNTTGVFTVDGARKAGQGGSGRVRAVIGASTASGASAQAAGAGSAGGAALQPSSRLQGQ